MAIRESMLGGALEQGLKAHLVVLVVDVHDGQRQQKLEQGEGDGVFACSWKNAGSGQPIMWPMER